MESVVDTPSVSVSSIPSESVTYANFGRRLLAVIIDIVILMIAGIIINLPFTIASVAMSSGASIGAANPAATVLSLVGSLVSMLVNIGYYVYFIGSKGQTLGKMAMKIKVVKSGSGQVPGYLTAFLREIIGKFLSAIIFFLGYFWMLWDPKKQTWHDKIAGTVVVRV